MKTLMALITVTFFVVGLVQFTNHTEVRLTIEIPKLDVGEYHRPYVAAWIEDPIGAHVADLLVWYDVAMKNGHGETWLKDLRQWWRRSGRTSKLPIDGVSGATRPVGKHEIQIVASRLELPIFREGKYTLVVEAAREVGGRELLRIPFQWDGKNSVQATTNGTSELGKIEIQLNTISKLKEPVH